MQTELLNNLTLLNTVTPSKGPAHKLLQPFAGHWKVHGFNGATAPGAPEQVVIGDEIYEWLDSEYFLINRFDRQQGTERFTGIGWIGYDQKSGGYLSYSIANTGHVRIYEVEITPRRLRFEGERERAVIELNAGGNTMSVLWEHTSDGKNWWKLCELQGHRLN